VQRVLVGVATLLEFDDGHQFLGLIDGHRDRRDPTAGDFLNRRLDVLGVVVAPVDDQQVLHAAHDEDLVVADEPEVSGSQPRPIG